MMPVDNNVVGGVQTESGTLARRLCGIERLEDSLLDAGRNARAIVDDFDYNVIFARISFQSDHTVSIHGIDSIIDDIRPYLVELAGIRLDARQIRGIFPSHTDAAL